MNNNSEVVVEKQLSIRPPYEAFYIEAMLTNCTFILNSTESIFEYIEDIKLIKNSEDLFRSYLDNQDNILDHLQNVILNSAALSRYFWCPRSKKDNIHSRRSVFLKDIFLVKEDNPLKNRDLRNHIEHFDEKLDIALQDIIAGNIIPKYLGSTLPDDGVKKYFFRAYFLDTGIFEILGKQFEIQPIVNEVRRTTRNYKRWQTSAL